MAFELADRELGTNPPSRPTSTSRLLPTPNGKRLEPGPRVHHNRAAGRRPVPTRTMVPLRITIPVSSLPALHHSMTLGGSDELHLSLAHSNEQRATSLAPGPTYPSRGPPRTRTRVSGSRTRPSSGREQVGLNTRGAHIRAGPGPRPPSREDPLTLGPSAPRLLGSQRPLWYPIHSTASEGTPRINLS